MKIRYRQSTQQKWKPAEMTSDEIKRLIETSKGRLRLIIDCGV